MRKMNYGTEMLPINETAEFMFGKRFFIFIGVIFTLVVLFNGCRKSDSAQVNEWKDLLDMELSNWDKFIGVPHYSITTLPNHPKGDGMNGIPLGLNNDLLNVFKTEIQDGNVVLHISGEIYGGLSTKEELGNYHFKTEFKWGDKKYEPRLNAKRDNGILYHAYGPHGAFWNVWMNSHEMQVQEGDFGDYYALGPSMEIRAVDSLVDNEQGWIYNPGKAMKQFGNGGVSSRCRRIKNYESPHGEWNTLEIICLNDTSIHIVNGHVVMLLDHSRNPSMHVLDHGKIQIQSEGAEAWYRKMMIQSITEIPEQYR
jgi:hypothetical protein